VGAALAGARLSPALSLANIDAQSRMVITLQGYDRYISLFRRSGGTAPPGFAVIDLRTGCYGD
jgi:hypothetical protein